MLGMPARRTADKGERRRGIKLWGWMMLGALGRPWVSTNQTGWL
jgi:hypothetical protein